MFPGMNPRQMQQAMKKLGIKQVDIDAIAVVIRTKDEDIIITEPSVQRIDMGGNISYQITGIEERRANEAVVNSEDVKTVAQQAGVSEEKAKQALIETDGDLAGAILKLSK